MHHDKMNETTSRWRWPHFVAVAIIVLAAPLTTGAAPFDDLELELDKSQEDELIPETQDEDKPPADLAAPPLDLEKPANSSDPLTAARAAFTEKNFAQCMELLIAASAQQPSLPPPRLVMADMYLHNNMRATGRALLERVAVEDSSHPELHRLFGSLALTERRWTEAVMHFEKALQARKPPSWTAQQRLAFELSAKKGMAVATEQRGDWRAAAGTLGELVGHSPTNPNLRDRWASALYHAGMTEKAFEQFKVSHLLDKSMSPPELSMGVLYVSEGNHRQADKWFARAVAKHPDNAMLRYQVSVALMVQDRAEESARHAAKAAELGLETPDLDMVRGYAARQLNVMDAAERFFAKVVAENPDDSTAKNQLALSLVSSDSEDKQQQALELARGLTEANSNSARAQATLAWVQYRMGHAAEAEALFDKATANARLDPESLYLAGRFYQEQGRMDNARRIAERVSATISRTGIVVSRPEARKWLKQIARAES